MSNSSNNNGRLSEGRVRFLAILFISINILSLTRGNSTVNGREGLAQSGAVRRTTIPSRYRSAAVPTDAATSTPMPPFGFLAPDLDYFRSSEEETVGAVARNDNAAGAIATTDPETECECPPPASIQTPSPCVTSSSAPALEQEDVEAVQLEKAVEKVCEIFRKRLDRSLSSKSENIQALGDECQVDLKYQFGGSIIRRNRRGGLYSYEIKNAEIKSMTKITGNFHHEQESNSNTWLLRKLSQSPGRIYNSDESLQETWHKFENIVADKLDRN